MYRIEYIRNGERSYQVLRTHVNYKWRDQTFATRDEAEATAVRMRASDRRYPDVKVVDVEGERRELADFRRSMGLSA
jgi:hypothetical protein